MREREREKKMYLYLQINSKYIQRNEKIKDSNISLPQII